MSLDGARRWSAALNHGQCESRTTSVFLGVSDSVHGQGKICTVVERTRSRGDSDGGGDGRIGASASGTAAPAATLQDADPEDAQREQQKRVQVVALAGYKATKRNGDH